MAMSYRTFGKIGKFFTLFMCVAMLCAGTAWAEDMISEDPLLEVTHITRVDFDKNGVPAYDYALFHRTLLELYYAPPGQLGSLTLGGGDYLYQNTGDYSKSIQSVAAGETAEFNLGYTSDGDYYTAADEDFSDIAFRGNADSSFSGKMFRAELGGQEPVELEGTLPNLRTTSEQLDSYVPYVEYTRADGMITGVKWRFVDPSNPGTALTRNAAAGIDVAWLTKVRVLFNNGQEARDYRIDLTFEDGDVLSGERAFDEPFHEDEVRYVRINFGDENEAGDGSAGHYSWEFVSWDWNFVMNMHHASRSYLNSNTWQTDHNHQPKDEARTTPHFNHIYPEVNNTPANTGTATIDFKNATDVTFEKFVTWEVVDEIVAEGPTEFPVYPYPDGIGWHYFSNDDGAEGTFYAGAETALPGQAFGIDIGGVTKTGTLSPIRATATQIANGSIPFIEFDKDEIAAGKITQVRVFFGDSRDATAAVKKDSDKRNITRVHRLQFRMTNGDRYNENFNFYPADGQDLDYTHEIQNVTHFNLADLTQVRLYFEYGDDRDGIGSRTTYDWRFIVVDAKTEPNPSKVEEPNVTVVENAVKELGLPATSVVPVDLETTGTVKTTAEYFRNDSSLSNSKTVSAIAVSQTVAEGGAVVLGAGTTFPVNATAIDKETSMDKPANFDELLSMYRVIKTFSGGAAIDLLATYGSDLFKLDATEGVVMKLPLVIIDDAAPQNDADVIYPANNTIYGVKLVKDGFLFVYDGKKNGKAEDPISLTRQDEPGDSGSSSGCATGGMTMALLAGGALFLASRKRG